MIVTCSHDRNAFVWTNDGTTWKPSLVILRIDRAALDVKWSPDGKKFAVASGSKCVPVCYFEAEHDWWVSKMIKKHKSTVTKVAWHPNSQLLATGSTDFKARVFSTYVRQVDDAQDASTFPAAAFGEQCWETGAHGWVNSVCWSPSGSALAWAGQDSSLSVVDFSGGVEAASPDVLRFRELPMEDLLFCSEKCVVGVGHEMNPLVFSKKGSSWAFERKLELKKEAKKVEAKAGGVAAARALFQNRTDKGQDSAQATDTLDTTHEASICCIKSTCSDRTIRSFTTSGSDGKIAFWEMGELELDMAALGL
ncbi:hypothetical protein TeGR_g12876 [Tetraparma gracilis]|jgi:actin related protein 2/3 complex subunit 1A/1B|uniref:Arp2/3 complex 41 kDa subunit n=1 Tax=Tetraparma gracilis TaxID=2962635 RepID=A0ABQ6MPQ6_9STRA|nr:hypothetical protein TeGR_g12876 [Tetraparma gracilis]